MAKTKVFKEEVKKKWIEALRSGEYKQSYNYLRDVEGYCCLGVLTDLCVKNNSILKWERNNEAPYFCVIRDNVSQISYPPKEVNNWACNTTDETVLGYVWEKLGNLNDCRQKTFKDIADFIEEEL